MVLKVISSGPVTEIVETSKPTLDSLPIIKSFPKDSGRFITFGITVSKNPETQVRNLGVYRLQVISSKKAYNALASSQEGRTALSNE